MPTIPDKEKKGKQDTNRYSQQRDGFGRQLRDVLLREHAVLRLAELALDELVEDVVAHGARGRGEAAVDALPREHAHARVRAARAHEERVGERVEEVAVRLRHRAEHGGGVFALERRVACIL